LIAESLVEAGNGEAVLLVGFPTPAAHGAPESPMSDCRIKTRRKLLV